MNDACNHFVPASFTKGLLFAPLKHNVGQPYPTHFQKVQQIEILKILQIQLTYDILFWFLNPMLSFILHLYLENTGFVLMPLLLGIAKLASLHFLPIL